MANTRLSAHSTPPKHVQLPEYAPENHGHGIVHLGTGAFHRAHQAVYTDDAMAASGGDWRITGISLRSRKIAQALNAQDGRYTLLQRSETGSSARIIASIDKVLTATDDPKAVLAALQDPATRIVSLTVSEKAYGLDRNSGGIDTNDPVIAADLADPHNPRGVIGLLVETLRLRRANNIVPYTILCCDNLPENGRLLKAAVVDFAQRLDPEFSQWIAKNVAFPSTMVDRITPAATAQTLKDARNITGHIDDAAIETEHFCQWVVEDNFPQGRPAWETGGAIFVADVAPYEQMKLRMLNGSHSMLAYAGFLIGNAFVRDVMKDENLAILIERHLAAAALTLAPLPNIDFTIYAKDLITRFKNPAIAHATYQIAMDGTQKIPQRLVEPALHGLELGHDVRPFAFAVACWMRYCTGRTDNGEPYEIQDPLAEEISSSLNQCGKTAAAISTALHELPGIFSGKLVRNTLWQQLVNSLLNDMLEKGMQATIAQEATLAQQHRLQ